MSTKFILPAIAVSIGLVQVLVPHLSRTYTLLGYRRDNGFLTSPAYTSTLDPLCTMQHPDKFLGCEDMILVNLPNSTVMFTACLSDYTNRKRVLSEHRAADAADRLASGAKVPGDKIFRWDLDSDEVVELELQGLPGADDGGDRAFHGMDINQLPDGSLSLYIINHRLNGSVVEKFTHDPKTSVLSHVVTVPMAGHVAHPNDVHAVPHLDQLNAFYVTDEHRYATGIGRLIEDYTRRPWANVHYYSTKGWKLAFANVPSANGVTGDKKSPGRVYISACLNGEVIVADEDPSDQGTLKELQRIPLGFMPDNLALSASGADVFIAGHAAPQHLAAHLEHPDRSVSWSAVARFSVKQLGSAFFGEEGGYTSTPIVEEILVDVAGRWINASATAVFRERAVVVDLKAEMEEGEEEEVEEESPAKGNGMGDLFVTGLTSRGILMCKDVK